MWSFLEQGSSKSRGASINNDFFMGLFGTTPRAFDSLYSQLNLYLDILCLLPSISYVIIYLKTFFKRCLDIFL
jgi:hypothetical protein